MKNELPQALCIIGPTLAKSGQTLRFSISSDCTPLSAIAWDLGDGTVIYDKSNILHRYIVTRKQIFTVTLITTQGNHSIEVTVTI